MQSTKLMNQIQIFSVDKKPPFLIAKLSSFPIDFCDSLE